MMRVSHVVAAVRERAPLVHCLTSTVTMSIVADGLLAASARPMMTETKAEAPTLVALADALLVNLGTLSTDGLQGIPATVAAATIPWVLDPAAVGPTAVRRGLAARLVHANPSVIRANASEVLVLADGASGGRGPDATSAVEDALAAAARLAEGSGAVVVVSGVVDHAIAPDGRHAALSNGTSMLPRVTGTGCLLGAMTAACCAVAEPLAAAIAATSWLNVAAERAAGDGVGPGTFRARLLDELDAVSADEVESRMELSWI